MTETTASPGTHHGTYERIKEFQIKRDQRLFKALAAGVTLAPWLHRNVFLKEDGRPATIQAFLARLKKLEKRGYIKTKRYHTTKTRQGVTAVVLDEWGINEAVNTFYLEREFIRRELPLGSRLAHEVQLAEIIRTIWREGHDEKKYKIDFMIDDREMRRRSIPSKRARTALADLRFRILPKYKDPITANLEIDLGSASRTRFKNKMMAWSDTTLVVTLDRIRMQQLIKYVKDSGRKTKTGFCVAVDIGKHGLVGTQWYWLPDNFLGRLDIL